MHGKMRNFLLRIDYGCCCNLGDSVLFVHNGQKISFSCSCFCDAPDGSHGKVSSGNVDLL